MKTLIRCLALAVLAALLLAMTQRRQINAVQREVARMEVNPGSRATPASTEPSDRLVSAEDIARLREENRDIHKLRGQITQSRERRRAFEQMRADNAQLKERIEQIKANPNAASAPSIPLSNKGQATPEAALETTFWAMHQGDIETLSRAMPIITSEFERMPPTERTNMLMMLRMTAGTISKLEVLDQTNFQDQVSLRVKIGRRGGIELGGQLGREESTFILRRTNDLWQIVGER